MKIETFFEDKVLLINKDLFTDERGWFIQSFDNEIQQVINTKLKQENVSFSKKNVVRGLHYQWSEPMGKLVQCLNGKIIDVIIDIRNNSNTFGKVQFFDLDEPNKLLWIPAGFAHGFISKTDDTIIKYMCNSYYNKDGEGAINIADQNFKIFKKLNLDIDKLIISDKDKKAQSFEEYFKHPKF